MAVSIDEFWNLAAASELLSAERCAELGARFAGLKGAAKQANSQSVAQWLVAEGVLTRYQAGLLIAGRPGPFVFGKFVITERIEGGRLHQWFKAVYNGSQQVLLVFASQLVRDREEYGRLVEQAQRAALVKNPHVSRTFQLARHRSQSFLVVESLEGQSLEEQLAAQGKLPKEAACQIGFQLALGLVAMHEQKLLHGAISPHNVWIDPQGTARLLQFPLVENDLAARRFEPQAVEYLPPELADAAQRPTPVSDVYSLGCLLFELLAGRLPFPGGDVKQKIARHCAEFPQRLDQIDRSIPEELADLVAEMLAKDPLLRCQSASHVAHLVAPFVGSASLKRVRPPKLDPREPAAGYGAWSAPELKSPPLPAKATPKPQAVKPQQPQVVKPEQPQAKAAPVEPVSPDRPRQPRADREAAPAARPKKPRSAPPPAPVREPEPVNAPAPEADAPDPTTESAGGFVSVDSAPAGDPVPIADFDPGEAADVLDMASDFGASFVATGETSLASPDAPEMTTFRATPRPASKAGRYWVAGGLGLIVVLLALALWFNRSSEPAAADVKPAPPEPAAAMETPADAAESEPTASETEVSPGGEQTPAGAAIIEIDDDGQTLWASPTSGQPLDLTFLPGGAQLLVALRPAELLQQPEGAKLLDALGPGGRWGVGELKQALGVELAQIEQLLIGIAPEGSSSQAAYVLRLAADVPLDALLAAWKNPAAAEHQGKKFFQGPQLAYYLPESGAGRLIAIAPPALLKESLALEGPPNLRADLERLIRHTDAHRHFTVIAAKSYLLGEIPSPLVGELQTLKRPLEDFIENTEAASLSAHLGEELYVEFRALAPVEKRPDDLLSAIIGRWQTVPERLESYVAGLEAHPYGRLVINRFPRMVQLAKDFTRGGVEDKQVVLSAYLPASAAHNLLLGAELTLAALPATGKPPSAPAAAAATAPMTVSQALAKRIPLSFPRESLDRCLAMLAQDLGIEIIILGSDLQLEGITKNQSLNNVNEPEQPAGDILRKVLKLANPAGKLVYVIRSRPDQGEALFITTRAAAKKNGDQLPAGF